MATSSHILSQTLQSLTTTKIKELLKQNEVFDNQKQAILREVDGISDQQARVQALLRGLSEKTTPGFPASTSSEDATLERIRRFLDQSRYDPTVAISTLEGYETKLRQRLDQQTKKNDFADLYSRLLEDWLNSDATVTSNGASSEDNASLDESFAMVEKDRLQQLKDKFAEVVFTPLETDASAITKYLDELFSSDDASKPLAAIRQQVQNFGKFFASKQTPFNSASLKWSIKGLLKSDLLSDGKRAILEEFLRNPIVMTEIVDVLNMRFRNLSDWDWGAEKGMIIQPRAQLNGKWRVMMDEDILHAILLHYIAVEWSVQMKSVLKNSLLQSSAWKTDTLIPREEHDIRRYYLDTDNISKADGINRAKQTTFQDNFFLTHLPSTIAEGARGYDDMDSDDGENPDSLKSPVDIKQQLLRQLATEAIIQRSLHGEVALIQSDIKWFATSLAHSTISAVWRFFGLAEFWMDFFRKFLEPPVQMSDDTNAPDEVRIRKRGVQMATGFEQLFGEIVLFPLDFAINRNADGLLLYRLHDDIWLCGTPGKVSKAWHIMKEYMDIMGLEFNESKTGAVHLFDDPAAHLHGTSSPTKIDLPDGDVRVGFLKLDATSGDWLIDQNQVDRHVRQLKKQLGACPSIFSWVQTWNSCIGRFFNMTFGQPANCFGRPHVDSILATHRKIHKDLFSGKSATDHLRKLILAKFGVENVPDAFIFFPEELGGLGLRNPFISLFVIREQLHENPMRPMIDFFEAEKEQYRQKAEIFTALTPQDRKRRASSTHGGAPNQEFMTFQDFIKYREKDSTLLRETYQELLSLPSTNDITPSEEVWNALDALHLSHNGLSWYQLNSERKWIIQHYSEGVFEEFGGLVIVDKALLPLGVMTMLRNKKVTWQAVL